MCQAEIIDELAIAFRLFDGVQVCALQVFDEGEGEQLLVRNVSDHGRNGAPAESGSSPESSLSRDEFKLAVAARPYGDGLKQTTSLEAELQLLKLRVREVAPGLARIRDDLVESDFPERFRRSGLRRRRRRRRRRGMGCRGRTDECAQSAT